MKKFDINQKVSTHLAFLLLLVISFALAWYSVTTGEQIVDNSKNSETFNFNKRTQKEVIQNEKR